MTSSNPISIPVRLWGRDDGTEVVGVGRHLFGEPEADKRFRAGELIGIDGKLDGQQREKLYAMMARLAGRMIAATNQWSEKLPGATSSGDNPFLPSGYTYLLQFVAHDLVDTVVSLESSANRAVGRSLRNGRTRPLMLDTLYGDGPAECPHLYVPNARGAPADSPRSLLVVSEFGPDARPRLTATCPAHDFQRSASLADVVAADPRNDAHPIVAQVTLLFVMLHNWIARAQGIPERGTALEIHWRRHLCARGITTLMYRTILERDVLPRLLHPDVLVAYRGSSDLQLDAAPGITAEFTAGAFRFAHALVRKSYTLNDQSGVADLSMGLLQSSRHGQRPDANWAVDWKNFFGPGDVANHARRIGPNYATPLSNSDELPSKLEARRSQDPAIVAVDKGLALRDFLTAAHLGLWSVPGLLDEARSRLRACGSPLVGILPDYHAAWREPVRNWLGQPGTGDRFGNGQSVSEDLEKIASDPPLPFFILFEAAHELDGGRPRPPAADGSKFRGAGGRTLGPLGSIIIADTLYPLLRMGPRIGQDESQSVASRMMEAATTLARDADVDVSKLGALWTSRDGTPRALDSMWALIEFLREQGWTGASR